MGGTVIAAAFTTGGCALPMFFCTLQFFFKMAVMIALTITLSVIFTLGFFLSCMILFGSSDEQGMLPCCREKSEQEKEQAAAISLAAGGTAGGGG